LVSSIGLRQGKASGESVNVFHIVGARPNFMKVAPVMNALKTRPHIVQTLVHTGQHYDANMSDVFLEQLGIPAPDMNLAVGSGTHARQTAEIMIRFEPVLLDRKPDLVLVYGDVNSTVAAAWSVPSLECASAMSKRDCAPSTAPCRRKSTGC
jgi:UDP-N-acetylglucosamine 2-epimerase